MWRDFGSAPDFAGVALDVLCVVQASNPLRRSAQVISGWSGARAGCQVVGRLGALAGTAVEPGGGTAAGGLAGCFAGGIGGYIIGNEAGAIVYDWAEGTFFTPLPDAPQP